MTDLRCPWVVVTHPAADEPVPLEEAVGWIVNELDAVISQHFDGEVSYGADLLRLISRSLRQIPATIDDTRIAR